MPFLDFRGFYVHFCCNSCNNNDKFGVKKIKNKKTYKFYVLELFTITEISLHIRVFIITLVYDQITKI